MKISSGKWRRAVIPVLIAGLGSACSSSDNGGIPADPSGLQATAVSSSQVDLSWTDNSDNEDGFKFDRKTGENGIWEYLGSVTENVVFCSDTGLASETTYYYRIYAHSPAGNSGFSNEAGVSTPPGGGPSQSGVPLEPSDLDSVAISSSRIDLSWTDNSDNEDGFKIERKEGVLGDWDEIADLSSGSTSYTDNGLECETVYYYRVISYNDDGNSDYSDEINVETQACSRTVPAAPSNLEADAVSAFQINLSWQDNSDNEDGFRIERKTGSGGVYSLIDTVYAGANTYADTGLSPNLTYYYRVRAYNWSGNSDYSSQANATTPGLSAQTVSIPAGCFDMGNPFNETQADEADEKPVHHVCLSAFRMDVYEVTNAQYNACAEAGSCPARWGYNPDDDYPVSEADWNQARAYCAWAGGRLPTEAEWEYAARGGLSDQKYPWGNTSPVCTSGAVNVAQYRSCTPREAVQVGSFSANGYGLYDMAGNVWEWVNDWYGSDYYATSPATDPTGPSSGSEHILRGGGWDAYADGLRVEERLNKSIGGFDFGFRCAR